MAIATVKTPPITTAGTAPTRAAAMPDSKAPSSFDAPMNSSSTALARPRISSGVGERPSVNRSTTLTMSSSASHGEREQREPVPSERPKAMIESPKRQTTEQRPAGVHGLRSGG